MNRRETRALLARLHAVQRGQEDLREFLKKSLEPVGPMSRAQRRERDRRFARLAKKTEQAKREIEVARAEMARSTGEEPPELPW